MKDINPLDIVREEKSLFSSTLVGSVVGTLKIRLTTNR